MVPQFGPPGKMVAASVERRPTTPVTAFVLVVAALAAPSRSGLPAFSEVARAPSLVYTTTMPAYTRKDAGYRAAQKAGFRSRSAIKLQEIDRRHRVLRRGQRVVDLGAWPGGWMQVAAAQVGREGRVVGVDLVAIDDLGLANVTTLVGDLRDPSVRERVSETIGGRADVVLSDMAPKLSGVKVADRERHLGLVETAVEVAAELLDGEGRVVIKLFAGVEQEATDLVASRFGKVEKHRPPSTRKGSSELYVVAGRLRVGER